MPTLVSLFWWAHPRVCGENHLFQPSAATFRGSSPRVRGKRGICRCGCIGLGLIPACAGKTMSISTTRTRKPAHPRVCGENGVGDAGAAEAAGSSPRVRGKQARGHGDFWLVRLIPACAGKTCVASAIVTPPRAHPRVCGENWVRVVAGRLVEGSSPRVRGKPGVLRRSHRPARLIPACAGKTALKLQCFWQLGAHPRVCGENALFIGRFLSEAGSSPRVRGKRHQPALQPRPRRLIPACAGKTESTRRVICKSWAHPRVCGENSRRHQSTQVPAGSSPRVRGKHSQAVLDRLTKRLIPACAGKTRMSSQLVFCS